MYNSYSLKSRKKVYYCLIIFQRNCCNQRISMRLKTVFRHITILLVLLTLSISANTNRQKVLISIAGESSSVAEIDNGWFAALLEGHFRLRFTPVSTVTVFGYKNINSGLNGRKIYYGESIGPNENRRIFTALNADFVINSFYEVERGGDTVSLSMELFSVSESKNIGVFDRRFSIAKTGENLDTAFTVVAKGLKLPIEKIFPKGVFQDISTPSIKAMKRFGSTWDAFLSALDFDSKTDSYGSLLSASQEFSVYAVGTFLTALAAEEMGDYANTAQLYNRLTLRNGLYYANFYEKILKNYRLSGNSGQSGRTIMMAERKGVESAGFVVEKARYLKKNKNYEEAFLAYQRAYELDSTFSEAIISLADIAYEKNSYADALKYYKKEIENNKNSKMIQERVVELTSKLNLIDDMEKELNTLFEIDPTNELAKFQLAILALKRKEFDRLDKLVGSNIVTNNQFLQYKKEYAAFADYTLLTKKDTTLALEIYSQLQKAGYKDKAMLLRVAKIKFAAQQYQDVVDAIGLLPASAKITKDIHKMMAHSFIALNQYDKAAVEVLALLKKEPSNPDLIKKAALCYEKTGNNRLAITQYKRYIKLKKVTDKDSISSHLVNLYKTENMTTAMVAQLKQNIALYPNDLTNYLELIEHYKSTNSNSSLVTICKKALLVGGAPDSLNLIVGEAYFNKKQYATAIIFYQKFLKSYPNRSDVQKKVADILYMQKKYSASIDIYQRYLASNQGAKEDYYKLADSYFANKEYKESAEYFAIVISKDPSDTLSYKKLLYSYKQLKDTLLTISTLENYIKIKKQNYALKQELVELYKITKRDDRVILLYEDMAVQKPRDFKVRENLIKIYLSIKDYNRAKIHIDKAIELKPKNAELHFSRAKYYLVVDSVAAAKKDLIIGVKLAPKNHKARSYYAKILYNEKDYKAAYLQYKTCTIYDKQNIEYLVATANSARKLKQNKNAIIFIEKALRLKPENRDVMECAGIVYANNKQFKKAKGYLEEVVKLGNSSTDARFELGKILFKGDEHLKAEKLLVSVITERPNSVEALEMLGDISNIFNRNRKAISYYKKAFLLSPKDTKIYYKLIRANLDGKNIKIAGQIVKQNPSIKKDGWSTFAKALVEESMGNLTGASKELLAAGRYFPKNWEIIYHKGLIKYRQKSYNNALKYFIKIVSYKKNSAELFFMIGNSYYQTKSYTASIKYINKSLALSDKQADAYYILGSIYKRRKKISMAEKNFLLAIKYDSSNWKSYYNLAKFSAAKKSYQDAIKYYLSAYKNHKETRLGLEIYRKVGDIYYLKIKDPKKATRYYKKYIRLGGSDAVIIKRVAK